MNRKARTRLQWCAVSAVAVTVFTLAGCAAYGGGTTGLAQSVTEVEESAARELMVPVVAEGEDGALYQRTPSDTLYDGNSHTLYPDVPNEFNTRFLDADNRGCGACHDDMAQTLDDMDYDHPHLSNGYGIEPTVQMCTDCHTTAHEYVDEDNNFGQLMHQIHADERSVGCWSCHVGTEDGNGMQLWDVVKYDWLRGIRDVENVEGDFSFTQDTVGHRQEGDNLFDFLETRWAGWIDFGFSPGEPDAAGTAQNEIEADQELFNDWTITITGAVENDLTWTLSELIDVAPSEDLNMKMNCVWNPLGGPYISNCEVRGIPLSWLFEQAGISEEAYGFTGISGSLSTSPEHVDSKGNQSSQNYYEMASKMEGNEDDEAYLVYMLDGTELTWSEGYPVSLWTGGYASAGSSCKQVADIVVYEKEEFVELTGNFEAIGWVTNEGYEEMLAGMQERQGWYINKPCVGVFDNREGRIMNLGESYTFEGYADSFDNEVTAVEFSMDGGQTWTSYATEGATDDRWVNWKFTYKPEEAGAYVLRVRAVDVAGLVTPEPIELMFNVKSA